MNQPVPPTTDDCDALSLPELDDASLEEAKGGAPEGEPRGAIDGHWDHDSF